MTGICQPISSACDRFGQRVIPKNLSSMYVPHVLDYCPSGQRRRLAIHITTVGIPCCIGEVMRMPLSPPRIDFILLISIYNCGLKSALSLALVFSCGVFYEELCPTEGCHDPGTGDYDVRIPVDVEPGLFSLYVEELSEGGPSDCVSFDVVRAPGKSTAWLAPFRFQWMAFSRKRSSFIIPHVRPVITLHLPEDARSAV